ncbi:MAG TPA: protein-disulfide reductase DsbD domain-containing protein [Paracoccaceae bacterium]|nr:protein-disulfide reductase DsbD domain-containing protein [Paracoccaceae bacterium]
MLVRVLLVGFLLAAPFAAGAEPVAPREAANAVVEYLDGWAEPDGSHIAALSFRLGAGWRTYWRTPGEAGIPPRFDWTGSSNIARVEYLWPVPTVWDGAGGMYLGYADWLVLPVRLTLEDPVLPAQVHLTVDFGVCANICVPLVKRVSAEVAPGAPAGRNAEVIRAALANLPERPEEAGVTAVTCRLRPEGEAIGLTAEMDFSGAVPEPEAVMIEAPVADLWIPPATAVRHGQRLTAETRLEYFGVAPLVLDRASLRLTVIAEAGAFEIKGCPAPRG